MLYVSTRDKSDSFTAYWALNNDRAPDGGMYVPFQLPFYDSAQIEKLRELSFSETVAQILNRFFSARLTGWDVEFCIGRYPIKLAPMNHRVVIAEIWHNPGGSFDYVLNHLYSRICGTQSGESRPSVWAQIAVYIAVLFGMYVELSRSGISSADVVLPAEDSSAALAAWYARNMGLPLGTIILGCKDNDPVWDLVQKGILNTNALKSAFVEQLLSQTLGSELVCQCLQSCSRRGTHQITQEQLIVLNKGLYAVVAGGNRVRSVISSVYRTNNFLFNPLTALSFGCLQDYRSHSGESRNTLLLAIDTPLRHMDEISAATGLPVSELKRQMTITKE